jgi:hypothetical protein
MVTTTAVRNALTRQLDPPGRAWLDDAKRLLASTTDPSALGRLFPAAERHCGTQQLFNPTTPDLIGWTVADAVRAVLLLGATLDDVTTVYHYGDTLQRRAVLRALPLLELGNAAVPLVLDALTSTDRRLLAAAVGRYAAEHLPARPWRHAVLKCLRLDVPLAWVAGLRQRTDTELVAMVRAYAEERLAAGRLVPLDAALIIQVRGQ